MKTETAQHTPGPWKVETMSTGGAVKIVTAEEGDDIAYTTTHHMALKHAEANARLIAAAPELLAIAKDALKANEDYECKTGVTIAQTKRVREAIAKAEGR